MDLSQACADNSKIDNNTNLHFIFDTNDFPNVVKTIHSTKCLLWGIGSIPICAKTGIKLSLGRRSPTHPCKKACFCEDARAGQERGAYRYFSGITTVGGSSQKTDQ